MKLIKLIIISVFVLGSVALFASFDDYEPSARARGMGGAFYSVSNDANAVFYNTAGLQFAGNGIVGNYTKLFGNDFQVLSAIGLSMNLPKKFGTLGIGLQALDVTYMDVTLTSEKTYSLNHAITIMKDYHSELHFGYSLNMYHLSFSGFGSQTTVGVNVGALAVLHQRTKLGFTVTNVNNPSVGDDFTQDLPQKMTIALAYEPYYGVTTALELKKSFDRDETEIHAGTEFEILQGFVLRTGIRNHPASYSAGLGLNVKNILVDYAYSTHEIGGTHHFSIGYKY
jgi:hypothetical protein